MELIKLARKKENAAKLADNLGMNRFEFDALVQMGVIKYEDELTRTEMEKIREKYYRKVTVEVK